MSRSCADLLVWFRARNRDVPWRGESDPYRIWVAEVMAQQTRIATVRDYYERFLDAFPDVETLAAAHLDAVLKVWEGLGYYARARNLHRAAARVVAEHGGTLPSEPDLLRSLPGIGRYTAGAIASLAFGKPEPAVDGNARRVLSRLFDIERPTATALDRAARLLIARSPESAAEVNQALMDLGASVCTPAGPDCAGCPLREDCLALVRGTVAERPPPRSQREIPHYHIAVGVVWRSGRVLVARRPESGLLGGLWEFPGGKIEAGETASAAVVRELREEMEIAVEVGDHIVSVDHAYSHFRITLNAYHAVHTGGEPRPHAATTWLWVEPKDLCKLAFPAANLRVLQALVGEVGSLSRGPISD